MVAQGQLGAAGASACGKGAMKCCVGSAAMELMLMLVKMIFKSQKTEFKCGSLSTIWVKMLERP